MSSHGECWESSNLTWRSSRKSNAEVMMHWWKGPVLQRCPLTGRSPHFPAWQTWIAALVLLRSHPEPSQGQQPLQKPSAFVQGVISLGAHYAHVPPGNSPTVHRFRGAVLGVGCFP